MPLTRVKEKYQVTLPLPIRQKARVNVGDLLEAKVEGKKITLTPKAVVDKDFVDRRLAESFEDFRRGRTYGPFNSAKEAIRFLHAEVKRRRAKKPKAS